MDKNKVMKSWSRRISFRDLSFQQRLPLLICVLLCSVILTFSFASYYGVRKMTLEMGKKRLRIVSDQLANMLTESSKSLISLTLVVARHDTIIKSVQSRGTEIG